MNNFEKFLVNVRRALDAEPSGPSNLDQQARVTRSDRYDDPISLVRTIEMKTLRNLRRLESPKPVIEFYLTASCIARVIGNDQFRI